MALALRRLRLAAPVVFAFVRIGTSRRAFAEPLTVEERLCRVASWLRQPVGQVLETDATDIAAALAMLRGAGTAGDLTTDAQLAALALLFGAVVPGADRDFACFPAVRWAQSAVSARARLTR